MEAQFWLNLQTHYDMEVTLEALQDRLDTEVHRLRAQRRKSQDRGGQDGSMQGYSHEQAKERRGGRAIAPFYLE